MKRFLVLAALVLGLAACQTEPEGLDVNIGGEVDTTITVSLPETTRANSAVGALENNVLEGANTLRYILQIYQKVTVEGNVNWVASKETKFEYSDEKKVVFPVRLVPNRDYKFVVWADIVIGENAGDNYYTTVNTEGITDLTNITLKADMWNAMDEARDAYTGVSLVEQYNGSSSIDVKLTRPFAKLRVQTTDMAELSHLDITPAKGSVTYGKYHYTKFNALTGKAYELATEYKTHNYNIEGYENGVLFVDYFFANDEVVQFYMDVKEANDTRIKENNFNTDIPVKRNYLTTISGNVLTDGNNVKVNVEDAFADADGNEQHIYVYEYNGYINEPLVLSTGAYIFRDVTMNLLSYDNAVIIEENADVTIDVVGKVNLKAAKEAIKVSEGATLTINGMQPTRSNVQTGEVVANGGIGSNDEGVTIKINDIAHLTATGHGDHAFGIGGYNANVNINNTTIDYVSGGHVQALFVNDEKYGKSEPEGGAAIGGANVTISNSRIIKAEGGSKAAAIGNSYWQSTEVVITNSTLEDIFGGNASAAIGGSRYASDKTTHHSVKVTITGSTITNAVGGQYGAGIGSGYDTHCQAGGEGSTAVNEITITNSTITAQGGKYAAGIGTGFHAASLRGSIDAESTINTTSGEPFYKGTYTFAQHIGYGVIDPAREGANLIATFTVKGSAIDAPSVYATYYVVNNYEELQAALNAAKEGTNTIVLGADITGNVTVVQKPGVKITIDGDNHKFNGYIKVHSNSEHYASAAVTFKNINFETAKVLYNEDNEPYFNFIEALDNGSERYSTNITAEDCTFTATDEAVNTAVGLQIKSSKNAKVIGCIATNMHSLIQAQSCDESVLVQKCKVVNGKNGVAFKQVKAATVENTTITATEYGIRFDGNTDNYGIVVKDNTVTAKQPLIVRKMTGKDNTITLEGTNTLTTEAEYQIVITNGSDDQEYVKPTGTYTLTGADEYTLFPVLPVAKVGNTEYTSIDEAIANWANNTTLTLLANVELSKVIEISSTEHHILDLGTYTMTAAKSKDAIQIINNGRSSASYALDIKADATNPGGITATSKAVVKTTGKSGVKDRPIIRFYNGIFNASNIISHNGSNGTNCPQFWFYGGVYNGSLSTNRALIQIYGGTFNGRFYTSVDSSAYMLISGGKFKYLDNLYGSALNSDKFTIGSSKGNFDRGVYVDDEGYFVVGGAVITEFGDMFAAKATNVSKAGTYLPYSSAAANGLYYTNADMAIAKHGAANVEVKQ